jgi:hypothetical protein
MWDYFISQLHLLLWLRECLLNGMNDRQWPSDQWIFDSSDVLLWPKMLVKKHGPDKCATTFSLTLITNDVLFADMRLVKWQAEWQWSFEISHGWNCCSMELSLASKREEMCLLSSHCIHLKMFELAMAIMQNSETTMWVVMFALKQAAVCSWLMSQTFCLNLNA